MSFKREGDDQSQLNILKKRRVADLLSNFIPEDEAALMKNGRYTCLVCSYRPVFDTVDTLTVHRNGKRHLEAGGGEAGWSPTQKLSSLLWTRLQSAAPNWDMPTDIYCLKAFYGKKARLKNEIAKRQQEKFVQSEDTGQEPSCSAPLLEQTRKLTHHALLKTVPYNSCHTKTSTKSEKGSLKMGSDPGVNSSSKTASERERVCRETEASHSSSQSSSSVCAAAGEGSRPSADMTGAAEPLTAQRRRELEHYLKLKSDGWLQDRSGRWVKDENVEFDSDEEEEPPSLTPLPSGH